MLQVYLHRFQKALWLSKRVGAVIVMVFLCVAGWWLLQVEPPPASSGPDMVAKPVIMSPSAADKEALPVSVYAETHELSHQGGHAQWFGHDVAIDGNLALVAHRRDAQFGHAAGLVYAYRRASATAPWESIGHLRPKSGHQAEDRFGIVIALSGHTCAIASDFHYDHAGSPRHGEVFIFQFDEESLTWKQTARLASPQSPQKRAARRALKPTWRNFGIPLELCGNLLIAGEGSPKRLHLFQRRSEGDWDHLQTIVDGGSSIALSEKVLAIGHGTHVDVYERQDLDHSFEHIQKLREQEARFHYGTFLSTDGDRIAISDFQHLERNRFNHVHLYQRSNGQWRKERTFSDPLMLHDPGMHPSPLIRDSLLVITWPFGRPNSTYVYHHHQGRWQHRGSLQSVISPVSGEISQSLDGNQLLLGAWRYSRAHLFDLGPMLAGARGRPPLFIQDVHVWPHPRFRDKHLPRAVVDGDLHTFTYLTEDYNREPATIALDFQSSQTIDRIRLIKGTRQDVVIAPDYEILVTNAPTHIPPSERPWRRVTGLRTGTPEDRAQEALQAEEIHPNGAIVGDTHHSHQGDSLHATLTFDPIQATALALRFHHPGQPVHACLYEIEIYPAL